MQRALAPAPRRMIYGYRGEVRDASPIRSFPREAIKDQGSMQRPATVETRFRFPVLYIGDCLDRYALMERALGASRRLRFDINRLTARDADIDAIESRQDDAWLIDACDDPEFADALLNETDRRPRCPARVVIARGGGRQHFAADAMLTVDHLDTDAIERSIAEALRRRRDYLAYIEQQAGAQLQPRQADGQLVIDAHGTIESANAAAEELLGYSAGALIGLAAMEIVPGMDALGITPAAPAPGENATCNGAHGGQDVWAKRRDGTAVPVHLVITNRAAAEPRQRRVATLRDLREAKESERQLRQSQRFLQATLNALSARIAILDDRGVIIAVNAAWRSFADGQTASRSSAIVGANYLEACHQGLADCGSEGACVEDGVRQLLRGQRDEFHAQYSTCAGAGTRWFVLRATRFPAGGPLCAVIAHEDITERTLLQSQLLQAQKLESIGQLAAGIAHEINTPTQYIGDNTRFLQDAFGGMRELLREVGRLAGPEENEAAVCDRTRLVDLARSADLEYLLDEIPKAISQSIEGIERVAGIVRAMKEFAHPGTPEKTHVDLNRAIQSTLTVARNEWKYVAEVVTDLQPDLPPVPCLPGEINQVVLNLVVNAAHAIGDAVAAGTVEKGQIRVSTRLHGDSVEIRVADNGTGIPPEIHGKVFDPFFSTKGVGKGTGQGLAISHAVVTEKHGGTITFETESGRGTTFIVRLPAHLADEDGELSEAASEPCRPLVAASEAL